MGTLREGNQEQKGERLRWLKETQEALKVGTELLGNNLLDLEVGYSSLDLSGARLAFTISPPYNLRETPERSQWIAQTKLFLEREIGIIWDTNVSCRTYSGAFDWEGLARIGEYTIRATIISVPRPPLCKLVEHKETQEVVTYEAICPELIEV